MSAWAAAAAEQLPGPGVVVHRLLDALLLVLLARGLFACARRRALLLGANLAPAAGAASSCLRWGAARESLDARVISLVRRVARPGPYPGPAPPRCADTVR